MRFEFNDDSQKICNSADVVNYGIQCDICGNKVLSVSNINGKRYCAGCYYKTFMKDNQKAEIDQLKQQLAEKDKEIEKLKSEIVKECKEHQDFIKEAKQITNQLKSNYQTQLAIQELEKVKNYFIEECEDGDGIKTEDSVIKKDIYEVADFIENQIKELKGEKDVKD